MSPFRKTRDLIGLTVNANGQQNHHWFYLFLTALADQDDALGPASVTFADPYVEVLHRLKDYEGFAIEELRRLLVPKVK